MVCECRRVVHPAQVSTRPIIIRVTVVRTTFHPVIRGNNSITAGGTVGLREAHPPDHLLVNIRPHLHKGWAHLVLKVRGHNIILHPGLEAHLDLRVAHPNTHNR